MSSFIINISGLIIWENTFKIYTVVDIFVKNVLTVIDHVSNITSIVIK